MERTSKRTTSAHGNRPIVVWRVGFVKAGWGGERRRVLRVAGRCGRLIGRERQLGVLAISAQLDGWNVGHIKVEPSNQYSAPTHNHSCSPKVQVVVIVLG